MATTATPERRHLKTLSLSTSSPASASSKRPQRLILHDITSPSSQVYRPNSAKRERPLSYSRPASASPQNAAFPSLSDSVMSSSSNDSRPPSSRRVSSMSYARETELDNEAKLEEPPKPPPSAGGFPRPPIEKTPEIPQPAAMLEENKSPNPAKESEATARLGATLVEQHSDLLSFIARRERKCLDLREELKKNEAELAFLKRKWESIVARDLAANMLDPALVKDPPTRRSSIVSPPPSASGRRQLTNPAPITEESYGAAKKWMGGLMKQGLNVLENFAPVTPSTEKSEKDLTTVIERDEDFPQSARSSRMSLGSSASTTDTTFSDSVASTAATSIDDHARGADTIHEQKALGLSFPGGAQFRRTSSVTQIYKDDTTPVASPIPSELQSWSTTAKKIPSVVEKKHKRKSTMDMLGSWSGALSSKLSEVANSDTFKSSKIATMNFVDTMEATLEKALDPRLFSPSQVSSATMETISSSDDISIADLPNGYNWTSPRRTRADRQSMSNSSDFDWTAYLEGGGQLTESGFPTSPSTKSTPSPSLSSTTRSFASPVYRDSSRHRHPLQSSA